MSLMPERLVLPCLSRAAEAGLDLGTEGKARPWGSFGGTELLVLVSGEMDT